MQPDKKLELLINKINHEFFEANDTGLNSSFNSQYLIGRLSILEELLEFIVENNLNNEKAASSKNVLLRLLRK